MTRAAGFGSSRRGRWASLAAALVLVAVSTVAFAQEAAPGGGASAVKAWDGGYKVGLEEGQPRDEVSGETMLVAAYGVLWLILILFVLRTQAQVVALRRESAELKALLESRLPAGEPSNPPASTQSSR
jgi:hypothetical protein